MVTRVKKWIKVEKRNEHFQIDQISKTLYVMTIWDENSQLICDYPHILRCTRALIDLQIDEFQDKK